MQAPVESALDVTVVMPAFNRSALIIRALDSVRQQRRHPKALIVVDDASTDDTVEQVLAWGTRTGFPVTVERMEKNGGPAAARNRGIASATTPLIAFVDSDDEHLADTLEKLVLALEHHPEAVVAFGDATKVTPTKSIPGAIFRQRVDLENAVETASAILGTYRLKDAKTTLLAASLIPTSCVCFRRADAMAVGGMPTAFRAGEDWLFWLKLTERGAFVCYLEDLSLLHRHTSNLTHASSAAETSRHKLAGLNSLTNGAADISLSPSQRERVSSLIHEWEALMRYQASGLGLLRYLQTMRSLPNHSSAGVIGDLVRSPRILVRALAASCGRVSRYESE